MNRILKNEMSKLINSGQAFTNPLGFVFNDVMSISNDIIAASELKDLVDSVTTRLLLTEVPISVFDDINDAIATMNTALSRAKQHTDELSGVVLDGQKNINSVIQIVQAAQDDDVQCVLNSNPLLGDTVKNSLSALNSASAILGDVNNTINSLGNVFSDLSTNNPFSAVFGFMTNAKGIFAKAYDTKDKYKHCKEFFGNLDQNSILDTMNPIQQQAVIDEKLGSVTDKADETTDDINEQVDADEAAYVEAQKIVLAKAITENIIALVGGSCSSQLIDKFRTPAFDAKLKQLTDNI